MAFRKPSRRSEVPAAVDRYQGWHPRFAGCVQEGDGGRSEELDAIALLLDRGADVNARATVDDAGVGGQTAIFHAVTQFDDGGLPATQLLVEHGADLAVRVKLPGDYERPGEILECTALGYALLFGGSPQRIRGEMP